MARQARTAVRYPGARAALALACCVLTIACSPRLAVRSEKDDLAVMTFNIRYGTADDKENRWEARKDMVTRLLRDQHCDLIGIQEALHFQLEELVTALPQYTYAGVGRDDGKHAGEYAAILYRSDHFRLDDGGTFWFSNTPNTPGSKHWGNNVTRVCTWALLYDRSTGRRLRFYNVHLDHESQDSRERSARLLLDSIRAHSGEGGVILTGDFNAGENNAALRILLDARRPDGLAVFTDTFRALHPDVRSVGTYHAFRGETEGEKIDFILVSPDFDTRASDILRYSEHGRYPSDHFPVTTLLRRR
jgi:endonuclease/exonuclease/phosphatase family metal-dependent hydrolase